MDKFEASNGAAVNETPYPGFKMLTVKTPDNTITLAGVHVDALREFFQHERDEELGRWRWPDNPDYVAYAKDTGDWLVLNEATGHTKHYTHREHASVGVSDMTKAARAYFEAHPERKPWHDAKPGEAWLIDVPAGPVVAVRRLDGRFYDYEGNLLAMQRVSGARRMYPEAGER